MLNLLASSVRGDKPLSDQEKAMIAPGLALPQAAQFKAWKIGMPITSNELLVAWAIYRSASVFPSAPGGKMRAPGEHAAALSAACTTLLAKISAAMTIYDNASKASPQAAQMLSKDRAAMIQAQAQLGKICGLVSTIKAAVDAAEVAYQKAILPPPVAQAVAAQTADSSAAVAQAAAAPAPAPAPAEESSCVIS
jgi:hypothetical protein